MAVGKIPRNIGKRKTGNFQNSCESQLSKARDEVAEGGGTSGKDPG